MIVSHSPGNEGRELALGIHDRDGFRRAPADRRARHRRVPCPWATCPDELRAHDIGAGDDGELWLTGLGPPTRPSRGGHF